MGWDGGFLLDDEGRILTTTDTTDASYWGGFLRDSEGKLVITYG